MVKPYNLLGVDPTSYEDFEAMFDLRSLFAPDDTHCVKGRTIALGAALFSVGLSSYFVDTVTVSDRLSFVSLRQVSGLPRAAMACVPTSGSLRRSSQGGNPV